MGKINYSRVLIGGIVAQQGAFQLQFFGAAVFTVDLFNEGIDIPSVDTLLLLRPTDSPTPERPSSAVVLRNLRRPESG